jgi:hypothetical protein
MPHRETKTPSTKQLEQSIPADDKAAKKAVEQAKAALGNVREGHEKAPPGAGGEPSWPTGGNISRGPKGQK